MGLILAVALFSGMSCTSAPEVGDVRAMIAARVDTPAPLAMRAGALAVGRTRSAVTIAYMDTGVPERTAPREPEGAARDPPSVIPRSTSATTGACDKEAMARYAHMPDRPDVHWKCMEWAQRSAAPHELWEATRVLVESALTDARAGLPGRSRGHERAEDGLRLYIEERGMLSIDPFDYAFASSHLELLLDYAPPELAIEGYRWQLSYLAAVENRERAAVDLLDRSALEVEIHQAQVVLVERLWGEIHAAPRSHRQNRAAVAMEALYRATSCHLVEHMPAAVEGAVPEFVLARHVTICEFGPARTD